MPAGTLPLLLVLVAPRAGAAEITDLPPWLKADAGVSYRFDRLAGSLVEGDVEVGSREVEAHRIVFRGVFTAAPGTAVFVEGEQIARERVTFPTANQMAYDPTRVHAGTMAGTNPLEAVAARSGSGFQGVWIGLRATPFSEAFARRPSLVTWMVEAAFRSANDSPFWTVEGSQRGAGEGGSAWRVATAFSKHLGTGQPYVGVSWLHTGDFVADLQDAAGVVTAEAVTLTGPDELDVRVGLEFVTRDRPSGARFGVDLRTAFSYRSWETMPSGVLLPEALELTRSIPVTGSESGSVRGGIGLDWRPFRNLQVHLAGDVGWLLPHEIEYLYPVLTGPDTLDLRIEGGLKARIR